MPVERAPRRRIVFALGVWQLAVATAAVAQVDGSGPPFENHLVLYGPALPRPLRDAMFALGRGMLAALLRREAP